MRWVNYHNTYLLGGLEANIITGRALAKTKNVRGGSGRPLPQLATPMWSVADINEQSFWSVKFDDIVTSSTYLALLISTSLNHLVTWQVPAFDLSTRLNLCCQQKHSDKLAVPMDLCVLNSAARWCAHCDDRMHIDLAITCRLSCGVYSHTRFESK